MSEDNRNRSLQLAAKGSKPSKKMITEFTYQDVINYISNLCDKYTDEIISKSSNPADKITFYPDIESYEGATRKGISCLFIPAQGRIINQHDSEFENISFQLLFLGTASTAAERMNIYNRTKKMATEFAKLMVSDSGFDVDPEDIKFFYVNHASFTFTPLAFMQLDNSSGGYELSATIGAPVDLYPDNNNWTHLQ